MSVSIVFRRPVHPGTIRSRLRQARLKARRPYKGPILTQNHRTARLQWARTHLRWTRRQWGSTLFTDESKFNVSTADGRKRVWRRRGEIFHDNCLLERNRWGGGSVHTGGISAFGKTELVVLAGNVNAVVYRDTILAPVVVPYMQRHLRRGTYQQDNARPHTARLSMDFLRTNGITVMNWPAMSADMSPIEHIWDELDRRVRSRRRKPTNAAQLRQALVQEWDNMPQATIQSVINSMRRRCQVCIASLGGHTRY